MTNHLLKVIIDKLDILIKNTSNEPPEPVKKEPVFQPEIKSISIPASLSITSILKHIRHEFTIKQNRAVNKDCFYDPQYNLAFAKMSILARRIYTAENPKGKVFSTGMQCLGIKNVYDLIDQWAISQNYDFQKLAKFNTFRNIVHANAYTVDGDSILTPMYKKYKVKALMTIFEKYIFSVLGEKP